MLIRIHSICSAVHIRQRNVLQMPYVSPFHVERPPAKRTGRWKSTAEECENREKRKRTLTGKTYSKRSIRVATSEPDEITNTAKRSVRRLRRFRPLAVSRLCAYFHSSLRQGGRLTHTWIGYFLSRANPLHASRNRSRKSKERHHHRSCTASNELPDKIYNKRIGEPLEIERSLNLLQARLLLWPILWERSS